MGETMQYPKTPAEFIENYSFKDVAQVYTNGSKLVPVFRVEQMLEHYFNNASDKQIKKRPIWKHGSSIIHKDYVDGHGETTEEKWADWTCPNCGWFVGEQYIPRRHNQQKCNYCSRCGQAIQWDGLN